jgi:glycosyltransferase involved in cell wall biosynthesis
VSCGLALLIAHENFLRPNGSESFDVEKCLRLIDDALVCRARFIAPISAHNRRTVETWVKETGSDWPVADFDYFNVCDFEMKPPTDAPRDRRGRHSRPGFEKFPPLETLLKCFPPHAESCLISGANHLLEPRDPETGHWRLVRWDELEVDEILDQIDFYVYWTNPLWREGFGRVIAEAIAAGKVVITDPGTAEAFGGAVVGCELHEIDDVIAGFIREPGRYRDFVLAAQAALKRFGPEAFRAHILANLDRCRDAANALL